MSEISYSAPPRWCRFRDNGFNVPVGSNLNGCYNGVTAGDATQAEIEGVERL